MRASATSSHRCCRGTGGALHPASGHGCSGCWPPATRDSSARRLVLPALRRRGHRVRPAHPHRVPAPATRGGRRQLRPRLGSVRTLPDQSLGSATGPRLVARSHLDPRLPQYDTTDREEGLRRYWVPSAGDSAARRGDGRGRGRAGAGLFSHCGTPQRCDGRSGGRARAGTGLSNWRRQPCRFGGSGE
jgi:hypothetical protein